MQSTWHFLSDSKPELSLAIEVIDLIRPSGKSKEAHAKSSTHLQELIDFLSNNETQRLQWGSFLQETLSHYNPGYLYRERSFLGNTNLFAKFWKLVGLKLLPKAIPANEMDKLLDLLFKKKEDYRWVKSLPFSLWEQLFQLFQLENLFNNNTKVQSKLNHNITLLSYRIAALGMDSDILNKMPELNDQHSPFLEQNKLTMSLLEGFGRTDQSELTKTNLDNLLATLDSCREHIVQLRANKREIGTSMHLTYISKRLIQQIDRIQLLLHILFQTNSKNFYSDLTQLFIEMLEYQEVKNSITKLLRESVNLVAFEIVEHTAQKGEKYIASNRSEYWNFLKKSMLGGLIIAIFATFKIQLDKMDVSPLGEGLLFGLNYAICFVLVYILGGIIATKQPAMTASSIVQAIDQDSGNSIHYIKNMVIRVSRSQFISFAGNLLLAFPMAALISFSFPTLTNDLLLDAYKSQNLLDELHPIQGGAYYYAGIAGIILSLAGLISGYFDNKVVYSDVKDRLCHHPVLRKKIPEKYLRKISDYIYKNSGALAGNISLGLLLGLTGAFGIFTGLPLDIRHVAFSSANLGFALEYSAFNLDIQTLIYVILGVLGIGLINFLVSFGMTFWITLRSRNASYGLYKQLSWALFKHLLTKPHHFILPVKIK